MQLIGFMLHLVVLSAFLGAIAEAWPMPRSEIVSFKTKYFNVC